MGLLQKIEIFFRVRAEARVERGKNHEAPILAELSAECLEKFMRIRLTIRNAYRIYQQSLKQCYGFRFSRAMAR
jgi:hypothetical protein